MNKKILMIILLYLSIIACSSSTNEKKCFGLVKKIESLEINEKRNFRELSSNNPLLKEAKDYCELSMKEGNNLAKNALGYILYKQNKDDLFYNDTNKELLHKILELGNGYVTYKFLESLEEILGRNEGLWKESIKNQNYLLNYYKKAGEQNSIDAQLFLARFYYMNSWYLYPLIDIGVDYQSSLYWYNKALKAIDKKFNNLIFDEYSNIDYLIFREEVYLGLGRVHYALNNYKKALYYYIKYLKQVIARTKLIDEKEKLLAIEQISQIEELGFSYPNLINTNYRNDPSCSNYDCHDTPLQKKLINDNLKIANKNLHPACIKYYGVCCKKLVDSIIK